MRTPTSIAFVLAALALAPAAAAGTTVRVFHLRWPAPVNQTVSYRPSLSVAGKVRSVTLTYKGQRDPRGFVFDYIVDCAHRGPAFLDWDWSQAGRFVLFRIDMTSGACAPGPTVAGKLAALTITVHTR